MFVFKLIKLIAVLAATTVAYTGAAMYGFLPHGLLPSSLLGESRYKAFQAKLAEDVAAHGITADVSKFIGDTLAKIDAAVERKAALSANQDVAGEPQDPISKAKKAVDEYNKSLQQQKEMLDSL